MLEEAQQVGKGKQFGKIRKDFSKWNRDVQVERDRVKAERTAFIKV